MNEPNLKQWKRRALKAEAELEMVRKALAENVTIRQESFHENAALRVALKEIQEASNWAYGAISGTLNLGQKANHEKHYGDKK